MSGRPELTAEESAASISAQFDPRVLARLIAFELFQHHNAESSIIEGKVFVHPDDTLVFDPQDERGDIELRRLRRSLENASGIASLIAAFFEQIDLNELSGRAEKVKYKTTRRLAVTLRDSLGQLSRLLNGEDLDDPSYDVSRFADEEVRLAEVYRMVKDLQKHWTAPNDLIYADCQAILDFISRQ